MMCRRSGINETRNSGGVGSISSIHTRVLRHDGVMDEAFQEQPHVDGEKDEEVENVLAVLLEECGQVLPLYSKATLPLVDVLSRAVLGSDSSLFGIG